MHYEPAALSADAIADLPTAESTETTFADLGLSEPLVRAVSDEGYTTPTPIQARAIPVLLQGRDLLGQAQTGTGKTAAFALPLLHAIDPAVRAVQALVLCPTRELALQVATAIHAYGKYLRQISVLAIFGGDSMARQLAQLSRGVQVVVGTPGRVLDHLERGSLTLDQVRFVVLDEADEMLRMGFIEDVETILGKTPRERQTALLSATLPPVIRRIAHNQLRHPEHIAIESATKTVNTINQRFAMCEERYKFDALMRLLEVSPPEAALIFSRTRVGADELAEALMSEGIAAEALHSDLSQAQRATVLQRLRDQRVRVVVATDVAARGLDIDHISHVINFDLPSDLDTYVHRIGRTGRAGRSGEALVLITPQQRGRLRMLERFTQSTIAPLPIPTRKDVLAKRQERLFEALLPQLSGSIPEPFVALANKLAEMSGHDATTVAALLLQRLCADRNQSRAHVPDNIQLVLRPDKPRPMNDRSFDDRRRADSRYERPQRFDRSFRPEREPRFERSHSQEREPRFQERSHPQEREPRFERSHSQEREPRFERKPPAPPEREPRFQEREPRMPSADMTKLMLAVGRNHGLRPQDVVGAIANEAGIPGRAIGQIEIMPSTTVVEIPRQLGVRVLSALRKTTVRGQAIRPQILGDDRPSRPRFPPRTRS
ncbi:MAG: DEAD/DEAH box helicase [Myxococcales bacterium]|nr:DEAD/DEAH box helicase [Myxococcales bacterium]